MMREQDQHLDGVFQTVGNLRRQADDMGRELDQMGRFLAMVVDYKHKIGFTGTILIDPLNLTIQAAGANDGLLVGGQDPELKYDSPDTTTNVTISTAAIAALVCSITAWALMGLMRR